MDSNNSKFAELVQNCESQPLYFLTEKDGELVSLLYTLNGNRPIKEERVKDLVKAIQNKTYIPPILVAVPSRQVIEGNHRLEAMRYCVKENIPFKIGMITCKDLDALEIARVINNTQVRWTANNRLYSYTVEGRQSYVDMTSFMEKYAKQLKHNNNYKVMSMLALFASNRSYDGIRVSFYNGTLKLKKDEWDLAELIFNEIKMIQDICPKLNIFDSYSIIGWCRARTMINVSTSDFLKRLRKKSDKLTTPKHTAAAWFDLYSHVALGL